MSSLSQYELLLRLRENMSGYNTLLLQCRRVLLYEIIPRPQKATTEDTARLAAEDQGRAGFLKTIEFNTWEETEPSKYIVMKNAVAEDDSLMKLVTSVLLPIFHMFFGERWKTGKVIDQKSNTTPYSGTKMSRVGSILAAALSSALPELHQHR
ncbi:hypothetical protein GGR58DRAFT_502473 [Xylaria digitata]|nr:hypothetical protein GGR58DRAFT_502473 [Xylaria digitata]